MHSYSILSFCDWLISLSTRSWWVLPAGRCVRITSFFKSWIRSHGMNTTVCSSTDEHELFDLVTTVNNSIMHRGSLWDADFSSLGYVSRSGITGSYNNFFFLFSFFFFWGATILLLFPSAMRRYFNFPTSLPTLIFSLSLFLFYNGHPNEY